MVSRCRGWCQDVGGWRQDVGGWRQDVGTGVKM